MHCYQALDRAALAILTRQPEWLDTPVIGNAIRLTPKAVLNHLVSIINDDSDVAMSDDLVRHLAVAGRADRDAITVLLAGHSVRIQGRLRDRALPGYHSDVISQLAMILMTDSLDGDRLAKRFVNRAHQAIFYAESMTRTRQDGHVAVDAFEPDTIGRMSYERTVVDDIADNVVDRFDLARFGQRVSEAIAAGDLASRHWDWLRCYRLVPAALDLSLNEYDGVPLASYERTRGHRAVHRIRDLAELHLGLHAA